MLEQVMELVQALGGAGQSETLLEAVCAAACRTLDQKLKDGLTPEDCQGAYPLAAAWLAMDWLRSGRGLEGVTALSAGDISVRREPGSGEGAEKLSRRAMELMGPYLRDEAFVFRGVSG